MKHLSDDLRASLSERLWALGGSLKGVGGLFTQRAGDVCFESGEMYGIGQFLKKTADELSALEDILRCGHEATTRFESDIYEKPHCDEFSEEKGIDVNAVELLLEKLLPLLSKALEERAK